MDNIWYRNPSKSEVIGSRRSLAVVVGMKKQMTTQNRQSLNA